MADAISICTEHSSSKGDDPPHYHNACASLDDVASDLSFYKGDRSIMGCGCCASLEVGVLDPSLEIKNLDDEWCATKSVECLAALESDLGLTVEESSLACGEAKGGELEMSQCVLRKGDDNPETVCEKPDFYGFDDEYTVMDLGPCNSIEVRRCLRSDA